MKGEARVTRIFNRTMLIWTICGFICFYPFFAFRYFETGKTTAIVLKYCLPPILFITVIVLPYLYWKYVSDYDKRMVDERSKKRGKKPINKLSRYFLTLLMYICLTIMATLTFWGTCFSSIIITNAYFGPSKVVAINEKILDHYTHLAKGGIIEHYIKFQNPTDNQVVELKVKKYDLKNGYFIKEMKVGCWGILYSVN